MASNLSQHGNRSMQWVENSPMQWSIVELIGRFRQRVDAMSRLAGRFMEEPSREALERISGRLARLAATLATPTAKSALPEDRLFGHLERLGREVSQIRVDDPSSVARVAWILAEIEEAIRRPAETPFMPVYTSH